MYKATGALRFFIKTNLQYAKPLDRWDFFFIKKIYNVQNHWSAVTFEHVCRECA